ncbi:MAG: type II toxin-antitoxin system VapC family toxin [Chloroflexi bacterium]|nr:type II toxin-antitoxin system VapC family toxin [Chloroflexota bacterium]MYK60492.1 type II toxin-antitoxin system VapC family toxin [Chloroflexota bacterium]
MLLLDTNIVSAVRRPDRHPEVARWLAAEQSEALFLSVVTIGEIRRGITRQERRDPPFAHELTVWLTQLLTQFGDRVLSFDLPEAQRWGRLSAELGHDTPDLMIAATALERGFTVVTRNVKDFELTGVETFDPSEG